MKKLLFLILPMLLAFIDVKATGVSLVRPEPGSYDMLPNIITVLCDNSLKSIDEVTLYDGVNTTDYTDYAIVHNESSILLTLPLSAVENIKTCTIRIKALDVDGNYVTYGSEKDVIKLEYVQETLNSYLPLSITPADGSVVDSLDEFILEFDMMQGIAVPVSEIWGLVLINENFESVSATISVDENNPFTRAIIKLEHPVTTDGTYTLVIPEGSYYDSSEHLYNPELTYTYTISNETPATNVLVVNPAVGASDYIPNIITVLCSAEISSIEEVIMSDGDNKTDITDKAKIHNSNSILVSLDVADVDGLQSCTFIIKAKDIYGNYITYGNEPNVITLEYYIEALNSYLPLSITPEDGSSVDKLDQFVLEFDMMSGFSIHEGTGIKLVDDDMNVVEATIAADESNPFTQAIITLNKTVTEHGNYTLTIPEGTIYDASDRKYNPELNYTYTIGSGINFIDIVFDSPVMKYSLNFGANYYKHTATKDGVLVFHPLNYSSTMFSLVDENGENSQLLPVKTDANYEKLYQADVKEGQTYYFITSYVISDTDEFEVYYSDETSTEITLESSYKDGDSYSPLGANLELTFDRVVDVDKYSIIYGDGNETEIPLDNITTSYYGSYYCIISLKSTVMSLVDSDVLKEGDSFIVKLTNIRDRSNSDVIYGDDGNFEVSLVLKDLPAEVVSITPDSEYMRPYYIVGGKDGYITFKFSEEIDPTPDNSEIQATYSYGDVDAGSYVTGSVPFEVNGDEVTINIQGIRFPEEINTARGGMVPTVVTFVLKGLKTVSGLDINPNIEGSDVVAAIYTVQKEEIDFILDFMPKPGMSVDGYSEIIVWTNVQVVFESLTLDYNDKDGNPATKQFSNDDLVSEYNDDYEGYVMSVPLNDITFGAGEIRLSVQDAMLTNGDYVTIEATFTTVGSYIKEVSSDEPNRIVKVYDVNGIQIREGRLVDIMNSIEEGIYIIDGRKTVINR